MFDLKYQIAGMNAIRTPDRHIQNVIKKAFQTLLQCLKSSMAYHFAGLEYQFVMPSNADIEEYIEGADLLQ